MNKTPRIFKVTLEELASDSREAVISAWHKVPGDTVVKGDDLVEVVTDKASFDVASPCDGKLVRVSGSAGSTVGTGDVIAEIMEN